MRLALLREGVVWTVSMACIAGALIYAYIDWWDRRLP